MYSASATCQQHRLRDAASAIATPATDPHHHEHHPGGACFNHITAAGRITSISWATLQPTPAADPHHEHQLRNASTITRPDPHQQLSWDTLSTGTHCKPHHEHQLCRASINTHSMPHIMSISRAALLTSPASARISRSA